MYVCMYAFLRTGEATPAKPPAAFKFYHTLSFIAPLLESSLLPTSWGGRQPPQPPRYVLDVLQRFN